MTTGIFDNAIFGKLFETRDGYPAVYLNYIPYSGLHKLFVQGFEHPILYRPDGSRKGGGRYVNRYERDLDIVKVKEN